LLPRECVSAEVQSGENQLPPQQVRVTLEGGDAADRRVRVTTSGLIDEPVVTVSVTLGCTAKVTRRFVAFIDPPLINAAQTASPAEPAPAPRVDSQVAPILAAAQGASPPPLPARGAVRSGVSDARPRATARAVAVNAPPAPRAERPARPARPAPSRQPSVARAAPAGARLQLETAAPVVARPAKSPASAPIAVAAVPAAPAASAVAEPASAAKTDESAELLAKERQRIQSLEDGLAKLRTDSQATQASMAALQLRLKGAESERYANPLVYALAGVVALLALAVAGLWWRQARAPHSSQWWAGPAPAPAVSYARLTEVPDEPAPSAPAPLEAPPIEADAFQISTFIEEDEPAPDAIEKPRELSVEELIDLEQQADFFIVLGQDEAAIELLTSHVRDDGGVSPLPYLKLLEIYRRRGESDAYERIRERFNRRFNSYAPDWGSDPQEGRTLEDYADTIARLQQLWSSPARVLKTLDASLFRRDKNGKTFDLPAYRELLFLFSVARDLVEHADTSPSPSVDLLLPLDDPAEAAIARLSATTQPVDAPHSDVLTIPLDLDVSLTPDTDEGEAPPSALPRTGASQSSKDINFIDFTLDEPAKPSKTGDNR
jgi:pilus assembly protein FimV